MKTCIALFVIAHLGFLGVYKMMEEPAPQVIVPDGWVITDSKDGRRKLIDPKGQVYKLNDASFIKDAGVIFEALGYPAAEMGWY